MPKKHSDIFLPDERLLNKIYLIRGFKVMLDSDLADLYGIETKRLNEQVKRNIDRFPQDFMFQLSNFEYQNLKSQFATSKWGGRRKLPYVFTEHGVLMLSSVLSSQAAIQVNIQIMRIFIRMREMFTDNMSLRLELEEIRKKVDGQDQNIELLFRYLDGVEKKDRCEDPKRKIGFRISDDRG